jgi:hypothetical protein
MAVPAASLDFKPDATGMLATTVESKAVGVFSSAY